MASSHEPRAVVDTVVLRYFLFVARVDLLVSALGKPLAVPRIVYDPDEGDVPEDARCELSRSIAYQQKRATDPRLSDDDRVQAQTNATRLGEATRLHAGGSLTVLDLVSEERDMYGRLTSRAHVGELGLLFPLDPGEAACLAMALHRGLILTTDDSDALAALKHVAPDHPYQRIRKLLREFGETGVLTQQAANQVHRDMTALNFWDREAPFPEENPG